MRLVLGVVSLEVVIFCVIRFVIGDLEGILIELGVEDRIR